MALCRRMLMCVLALLVTAASAVAYAPTASAKAPRTIKKIIRPVHRNGTPVKGWRVKVEQHDELLSCSYQSYVSKSPRVAECGSTADYLPACWKSTYDSVLCLRDPLKRVLVRIYGLENFDAGRVVKHPAPMALKLKRYGKCTIRIGGAWDTSKQHPDWYGSYSCDSKKRGYSAIYGPAKRRDGIVYKKKKQWRVSVLRYTKNYEQRPFVTDKVRVAYYVGTAR